MPQLARRLASLVPELGTVYRVWIGKEIDPGLREELMLAVSQLNDCRYCSWGHHEWAHLNGVSDEELAHLEQLDPSSFDRRTWVAISFVRALVEAEFGDVQPALLHAMQRQYSPQEIRDIELVSQIMDIGNRSSNTFDAMLSRLRGTPAGDSRVVDELMVSGVFLFVAPIVLLYLSHSSGRPVLELARSLIDYTKAHEKESGAKRAPR